MHSVGRALLVMVLLWAMPVVADELTLQPLTGLLRGSLAVDSSSATIQPALGRAISDLADLYMARRIGRPAVEQIMGRYQDMLRNAGPDAIIAVTAPAPALETVRVPPDSTLARILYEAAASYGHAAAWIRIGTLYLEKRFPGEARDAEKAFAAFSRAAASGSAEGQLRAAELSILGLGTRQDIAGGMAALRSLATTGDSRTLQKLATLCLSGRIPLQPDLALTALRRAAELGSVDADLRLGDLYLRGEDVANDDAIALAHYKLAAGRGLKDAEVRIAEMQARGWGLPQDVEAALATLEALAKAGQTGALIALGDLHATGEVRPAEPARARDFYAAAAEAGSGAGLRLLGDGYLAGWFGPRSVAKAAEFYRRSMEAARPESLLALGRLEVSSPEKQVAAGGIALLRQAFTAEAEGAAPALADAIFYGYGTRRSSVEALALLRDAAAVGDRRALLSLVSAYRDGKADGRTLLVRKDMRKAEAALASAADRIPAPEMRIQRFLLNAAAARAGAFPGLTDRFLTLSRPERMAVFRELPKVNPNLYVWLAKGRLGTMGLFSGRVDGRLDRSFIKAMAKHCRARLSSRQCNQGPLGRDAVRLLAYAF